MTDTRMNIKDRAFTGFFFMPTHPDTSRPIKIEEVYAIEVHTFYRKDENEILKDEYPNLYNQNEQNYERRK